MWNSGLSGSHYRKTGNSSIVFEFKAIKLLKHKSTFWGDLHKCISWIVGKMSLILNNFNHLNVFIYIYIYISSSYIHNICIYIWKLLGNACKHFGKDVLTSIGTISTINQEIGILVHIVFIPWWITSYLRSSETSLPLNVVSKDIFFCL